MFLALLLKVLPLYLMIAIGYVAGRFANISDRQIADFIIHFIAPFVLLAMAWQAEIDPGVSFAFIMLLAVLTLFMAGASYFYGDMIWGDKRKNLFSNQILGANTGYFGIPVAFALFAADTANLWILAIITSTIIHNSVGYYILARGNLSPWDGFQKLLRLPLFWSMILGLALSIFRVPWIDGLNDTMDMFKGAYFVLGMAIIGLSMARLQLKHFDLNYIWNTLLWRFPVWTLVTAGLIYLDQTFFGLLTPEYYGLMFLYALMPLPANSVAYAAQLDVHPQRAAAAVLASTLVAIGYIPLMMSIYTQLN